MKKCTKLTLISFVLLMLLLCFPSFATSSKIKNIDVNNLNFNSIDKSKVEDLKKAINNIDVNSLDSATIIDSIDKNEISNGNINSIDTNAININEVTGIYKELSKVISNKDIADLIKDNSKVLEEAGISKEALSTSETLLRTFDSDAIIDIVQNDLDINELLNMYKNGSSLESIISKVMSETSMQTKINIICKLLFSNFYIRFAIFCLIIVAIYSIFITSLIFKKARKKLVYNTYSYL